MSSQRQVVLSSDLAAHDYARFSSQALPLPEVAEPFLELEPAVCWQAVLSRDKRFNGRFFAGVLKTKVYCRSVCPVFSAKLSNVTWFHTVEAAESAGFRACRRCNPRTTPGTPAGLGTAAVVSRALRLIWQGGLDSKTVDSFAEHVGMGSRQLRRLFEQHLGVSPARIAGLHRIHFARQLLQGTDLPITEVAFCSGFRSVRQFNHAMKSSFGMPPSSLRREEEKPNSLGNASGLILKLPYRPPFQWDLYLEFLKQRAVAGLEAVRGRTYSRTIRLGDVEGVFSIVPEEAQQSVEVRIWISNYEFLYEAVERIRRVFDLNADIFAISQHLSQDSQLKPLVEANPGIRVPGVWEPFELLVRTMLGETPFEANGNGVIAQIVERFGSPISHFNAELNRLFPRPDQMQVAKLESMGISNPLAEQIRSVARAICKKELILNSSVSLGEILSRLQATCGMNESAARYVALRACDQPDAFVPGRAAISNFVGNLQPGQFFSGRQIWSPWRGYATMYLWAATAADHRIS